LLQPAKKMAVSKQTFAATRSAVGYINRVGQEDQVGKRRVRNLVAGRYDKQYEPPIPIVTASVLEPMKNSAKQMALTQFKMGE